MWLHTSRVFLWEFSRRGWLRRAARLSCATLVARQALQPRHIDPVQDHRQLAGPQLQSPPRTLGARQLEHALRQPFRDGPHDLFRLLLTAAVNNRVIRITGKWTRWMGA